MRVRVSNDAAGDLKNIKTRIENDGVVVANQVIDRIGAVITLLSRWPRIGHDGIVHGTFEMVVPRLPFVIVYRIDFSEEGDELVVLRVYHVARQRKAVKFADAADNQ